MTVTALDPGTIFGGIDTHADTIRVAAIDPWGRELDDAEGVAMLSALDLEDDSGSC